MVHSETTNYSSIKCVEISYNLPSDFSANGIAIVKESHDLIIVGKGNIAIIDLDNLESRPIQLDFPGNGLQEDDGIHNDMEGVTSVPMINAMRNRTVIYIGCEIPDVIYEYDVQSRSVLRIFDLGVILDRELDDGIEGLVFIENNRSSESGYFYIAHQITGYIYVVELSLIDKTKTDVTLIAILDTMKDDLTGVTYQEELYILAIYDSTSSIRVFTFPEIDGNLEVKVLELVGEWTLPGYGVRQQGVSYYNNFLFIAEDDSYQIWKYYFNIDNALLEGEQYLVLNCLRPLHPVVIIYIIYVIIYFILLIYLLIRALNNYDSNSRVIFSTTIFVLLILVVFFRLVFLIILTQTPQKKIIGYFLFNLGFMLPYVFMYAGYTLFILYWLQIVNNIEKGKLVLSKSVLPISKPVYITFNIVWFVLFIIYCISIYVVENEEDRNIVYIIFGIIFCVICGITSVIFFSLGIYLMTKEGLIRKKSVKFRYSILCLFIALLTGTSVITLFSAVQERHQSPWIWIFFITLFTNEVLPIVLMTFMFTTQNRSQTNSIASKKVKD